MHWEELHDWNPELDAELEASKAWEHEQGMAAEAEAEAENEVLEDKTMKNECKGCQDRDRMITLLAERIDELAKEIAKFKQDLVEPTSPSYLCDCLRNSNGEILEWSDKCMVFRADNL